MTKLRRALTGIAFTAMLALTLAATQGTAWAASMDLRGDASVADGRNRPTAPQTAMPPKVGGILNSLGVSWED